MTYILRQSTAATLLLGPFVDSTDGDTEETGLTISQADVRLSKNGGNMAQKNESSALTHDELGMYACDLDATDTNTVGRLDIVIHESGALIVRERCQVIEEAAYDAIYASSASPATAAALATVDTVVDAIKAVTDNLPDSGALSSLAQGSALATVDTVVDAIKAVTDLLPDAGALSSLAQGTDLATVDTVVDAIKAVTDALPDSGSLTSIAQEATLGSPSVSIAADIAALNDLSAADVNAQVVDALATDTYAEPGQGAPGATISIEAKVGYLYQWARNRKRTNNSTGEIEHYEDDATTIAQTRTFSDDGSITDVGEIETGP